MAIEADAVWEVEGVGIEGQPKAHGYLDMPVAEVCMELKPFAVIGSDVGENANPFPRDCSSWCQGFKRTIHGYQCGVRL